MTPLVTTLVAACCWLPQAAELPPPPWIAAIEYEQTHIGGGADAWHTFTGSLMRRFDGGALGASVSHVDRRVASDVAFGLDAYAPLWRGAYVNARGHVAPDANIVPRYGAAVELFQSVAAEWELSAAGRQDHFSDARVTSFGASVARISEAWTVRGRGSAATVGGEWALLGGAHVRRTVGDRDSFVELGGFGGRDVVEIVVPQPAGVVRPDIRSAIGANATAQWFAARNVGARIGAGYSRYGGITDRIHGRAGVVFRW